MVSLKFQKRLAAGILQCGRGKVWLANGVNKISMTDFRQNTRKLVKDGFIIRKPSKIYSKSRARWMKEAKRKEPPPHQTRHQLRIFIEQEFRKLSCTFKFQSFLLSMDAWNLWFLYHNFLVGCICFFITIVWRKITALFVDWVDISVFIQFWGQLWPHLSKKDCIRLNTTIAAMIETFGLFKSIAAVFCCSYVQCSKFIFLCWFHTQPLFDSWGKQWYLVDVFGKSC